MIFTSLNFLIFFSIVFLVYYILPKKFQWIVLLIASIYFYISASVQYILYVLFAATITYSGALLISKLDNKYKDDIENGLDNKTKDERKIVKKKYQKKKKLIIIFTILGTLSLLIIMKYISFIIQNISYLHKLIGLEFNSPTLNFILPIGISFYTFMGIGYAVDVYRGEYSAEKNFLKYLNLNHLIMRM